MPSSILFFGYWSWNTLGSNTLGNTLGSKNCHFSYVIIWFFNLFFFFSCFQAKSSALIINHKNNRAMYLFDILYFAKFTSKWKWRWLPYHFCFYSLSIPNPKCSKNFETFWALTWDSKEMSLKHFWTQIFRTFIQMLHILILVLSFLSCSWLANPFYKGWHS